MNKFIGIGRLVADPELKYTPTGNAVSSFTIAINRPFKQDGEQKADFINCVTWRKQAENLANYQKKGNLIAVDGRIQVRNYENQEGKKIYVTEVVADNIQYLESKNKANTSDFNQAGTNTQGNQQRQQEPSNFGNRNDMQPIDVTDDMLPF